MELVDKHGSEAGLRINIGKTKTLVFGKQRFEEEVVLNNQKLENVPEFTYLGSVITWDNNCMKDIKLRIAKAKGVMSGFNSIWKSKVITYKTKLQILKTCVLSVALYACETWTLKKTDKDKLKAFEVYCYRRILRLSWTQKVTNKEVRRQLHVKEDIIQEVMRRKLNLFGHICRMDDRRLIKTVMLGGMEGGTKRGRPCREWLDDIEEWGQKSIQTLSDIAKNRQKWRETVKCAVDTYGQCSHGV